MTACGIAHHPGDKVHYYDHGLLGATLAVGAGAPRRLGVGSVLLAALVGMVPDWDALTSKETYESVHRVWGHNLFAVLILGASLGALAWWIQRSVERGQTVLARPPTALALWIVLGVLIMLSHPLMDVLYCGGFGSRTWPVQLFWPFTSAGYALPCVPWLDRATTSILAAGLLGTALARRHAQAIACITLVALAGNVICWRVWGI